MVNRTRYRDVVGKIDTVEKSVSFTADALLGVDGLSYPTDQLIAASTDATFFKNVLSVPVGRLMCEKYLQPYVVNVQNTLTAATTLFTYADVYTHNTYNTTDNTTGNAICIPISINDDGDTYMDLYSMNDAALTFRLGCFVGTRALSDAEKKILVGGWDAVWNGSSVGYLICRVFTKI